MIKNDQKWSKPTKNDRNRSKMIKITNLSIMLTLDNTSCLAKKSSLRKGRKERIRSSTHSPNASWRAKVFPLWKVDNCRVKRTGGTGSAAWPEWITNAVREICIMRVSGFPRPRKCWRWENKWLVWNTFRWLESQDGPFWYLKWRKSRELFSFFHFLFLNCMT